MNKPNFFVVGAAKAGTTSLYYYLDQHPDVYMSPIKEPHYFCKDIRCKDFSLSYKNNVCFDVQKYLNNPVLEKKHIAFVENKEDYLQLFRDRKNEILLGEISNGYLYSQVAAEEIYQFNPNAKIVMILRDPTERAFSHWLMDLRGNDVYRKSFLGAIEEDHAKKEKGWGKSRLYIELGWYYGQVKRYLDVFPNQQVLIIMYDDLKNNPDTFFSELLNFLEIEPLKIDVNQRHNVASIPKYPTVNALVERARLHKIAAIIFSKSFKHTMKNLLFKKNNIPRLTNDDREQLRFYFHDDVRKLEELIDQDLSAWYQSENL